MRPLSDYNPCDALTGFGILKTDDIKILDATEVEEFKSVSHPFVYCDEVGVVLGFRKEDGTILVTHMETFAESKS